MRRERADASGWVALMREAEGGGMGSFISMSNWILLLTNGALISRDQSMVNHSISISRYDVDTRTRDYDLQR